jgi:uncharacterized protein (TIGR03083 family)
MWAMTRLPFDVYLDHLEADSARFAEVLDGTDPRALVPACPDWDAFDLAYHLAKVQHSWTQIVSRRLSTGEQVEAIGDPVRPERFADCVALVRDQSDLLLQALRSTAPETPAWTWSNEQSVGFTYRRQAHEALIHRLDAEQAAGSPTPLPADLSADGVDEVLRIMYGGCPPWGTITPIAGRTVRLRCTDTGDSWLVTMATFTGDEPGGDHIEEPDIQIADTDDGSEVAASISATAADLDAWLWHRLDGGGALEFDGDEELLGQLRGVFAHGIN